MVNLGLGSSTGADVRGWANVIHSLRRGTLDPTRTPFIGPLNIKERYNKVA